MDGALLGGILLVGLALIAVASGDIYLHYRFNQVTKVTVEHLVSTPVGLPFNVLLIGSDSRANLSGPNAGQYGSASSVQGQRSDVVKIVHIVPATGQASVLSIPRDTMVTVAGDRSQTGEYNRINTTFGNGPDQLVATIQANFGITIQHVVQISFSGFQGAVDAVGGINLDFPYPARDLYSNLHVPAGCQHLDGEQALAVARSRHYQFYADGYWQYDPTSDWGRIQRQNAFLRALIAQAETKYDPLTLNAFIGSVVQGITVDSTFSIGDMVTLAREFHTFSAGNLTTLTLPTYQASDSEFGALGDVLYVDQTQSTQVITEFLNAPPQAVTTPPPGPYGAVAPTTTTLPVAPSDGGTTPATSAPAVTTTTVDTSFDPSTC